MNLIAVLIWITRFSISGALSSVLNMTCFQRDDRTIYTILDRPPSVDCFYNYRNATKHVIAHNTECVSLVLNNSLDGLVTFKCITEVFYEATCNKGQYYTANCTVSCAEVHYNKGTAAAIVCGVLAFVGVVVMVLIVVKKKLRQIYGKVKQYEVTH